MPKSRKRPKKKSKPEDQHAQFVETARRLGADMDEETFKKALGKIAPKKPPTPEEIARLSTKEKYDLFGTRFPKKRDE